MRLRQYINESSYRFEFDTKNGIKYYDELFENNLIPSKDRIIRYQKNKNLVSTVYIFDNDKIIGWAILKYRKPTKNQHIYGYIDLGVIGVFIDPKYRKQHMATQILTILEQKWKTIKNPTIDYQQKYKMQWPTYEIYGMKKSKSLITRIFKNKEEYYRYNIL